MDLFDSKHFDFLKEVSIFSSLSTSQLTTVSKYLHIKEVERGQVVFSRLEKEQILYIVRYGELALDMVGGNDTSFSKGDVFGEIAVLNNNFRTGTIKATEPTLLFCLKGEDLINNDKIPAEAALKIVVELAKMITSYLSSVQNTSTHRLIEIGESEFTEFKSTLRYNLHTKKFGKEIEHAALKTIAAFLNSAGGTLIIGVDDDKNILGLKNDNFKDDDRMLLHLTMIMQDRISIEHTQFIKGTIEESDGLKVLRVDVKPAATPAYLIHNNEEMLYVRTGPATTQMKVSEVYSYVQARFHQT